MTTHFLLLALLSLVAHGTAPKADLPKERENFQWGVVRAWRSTAGDVMETPGAKEMAAGMGDAVLVEVKNFNGWVVHCADLFGTADAELFRDLPAAIRSIVQARQLLQAAHAARVMRSAAKGDLKPERIATYKAERVLTDADEAVIELSVAFPKLWSSVVLQVSAVANHVPPSVMYRSPLAPNGSTSPREVIDAVLDLPSFTALKQLFPATPLDRVALLGDVSQFIARLQNKVASDLRLKINEVVFDGIVAENPADATKQGRLQPDDTSADYSWFRFQLAESEKNTSAWLQFRKLILLRGNVQLTLAHAFGDRQMALPTLIRYVPKGAAPEQGHYAFQLIIIPGWQLAVAIFLFAGCIAIFWVSASRTELLEDPDAPPRPDGLQPYSLARSQMAFWFILVIASFLFLWVSSGKMHVLNETCLWLIGIGSGTALGAAMLKEPRSEEPGAGLRRYLPRKLGETRPAFESRLVSTLNYEQSQSPRNEPFIEALLEQHYKLKSAGRTAARRVLDDWLTEENSYSFHRYQMLTWTIVLGGVFIVTVWRDRTLPVFDSVMLALLGISNGTYLGFKLAKSK